MSVEYTIICDGCGVLGDASGRSAAVARKALREQRGWSVGQPGGQDRCSSCQREHIAAGQVSGV